MKTVVCVPALNEERTIRGVVRGLREHCDEVIVIDDGSEDATSSVATSAGATVVRHRANLGKGAALLTGCELALRGGATVLAFCDADGQHLPSELGGLLRPIEQGEADIVFGARALGDGTSMPEVSRFGNRFLSAATRVLFRTPLHDTQCGFRAITRSAYETVSWGSSG